MAISGVTSEPGKGATFKLYFPRVSEEAEPIIPRRFDPPTVGGSETILVVEDDPALRELVVDLLKESGYKVLAALDTKQAIDLAKRKKTFISSSQM
jgi:PleD family two-component response regulator